MLYGQGKGRKKWKKVNSEGGDFIEVTYCVVGIKMERLIIDCSHLTCFCAVEFTLRERFVCWFLMINEKTMP